MSDFDLVEQIHRANAEIRRLCEVLEPFARCGETSGGKYTLVEVESCRKAHEVLTKAKATATATGTAPMCSKWSLIETAPTDEMFIYYVRRGDRRSVGLAYRTVTGEWRDSEAKELHIRLEPTHWMPLPPSPQSHQQSEEG